MDYVAKLKARHTAARPITIAHRAGNELSLLRQAEAAGVDMVEVDLWFYRGRLEVQHLKTLGPAPILWDRWRLAPSWLPRLQLVDLLEAVGEETTLLIDLKGRDRRLPEALVAAVERQRVQGWHVVSSQSWSLLDALGRAPGSSAVYSIGNRRQLRKVWSRLDHMEHPAVSIHQRLLDAATVRALKERSTSIITWPVNDERRKEELVAWGVDGIISDNLELLRQTVRGA